jgi:membrane protease YdiL (CAAX protease family)
VGWQELSAVRLDQVSSPGPALDLLIGRTMALKEAIEHAPAWERWLYRVTLADNPSDLDLAIAWYEELVVYSRDPLAELHLAILEEEAGRRDRLRGKIEGWALRPEPFPTFARLIRVAYLDQPDLAQWETFRDALEEELVAGWFRDRLALAWVSRAADAELLTPTLLEMAARTDLLLWQLRGLMALDLVILLVGLVGIAALFGRRRHDASALAIGPAPVPPPWSGSVGTAVLLGGFTLVVLLLLGSFYLSEYAQAGHPLLRLLTWPWSNLLFLPLLFLAHRYLLKPAGLGLVQGLGLRPVPGRWGRLALAVPALVTAGTLGDWALAAGGEWLRVSWHWTEWFNSDLAWGSPGDIAVDLLNAVVFAPFFEEIVFRGLLFASLRRQFGLGASAALSAATFAAIHGYSLLGFLSVFWSGLLWAWAYEKTGSLLPGMVAHGADNLLGSLGDLWLLRG